MVPVVVLALTLLTPAFTFPFLVQDSITNEAQWSSGTPIEGTYNVYPSSTQGEKTGFQGTQQGYSQENYQSPENVSPVTQYVEKTGVQSPAGYTNQKYVGVETVNPQRENFGPSSTYTPNSKYVGQTVADQTQQTGVQPETYTNQKYLGNQNVQKTEEQVNVQQIQGVYPQQPVLPSVQQLSVVPGSSVLTPVVPPLETAADKRTVIGPVEPIPQNTNLQEVIQNSKKQVPYQQVQSAAQEYVPSQNQEAQFGQQQALNVRPEVTSYPVENEQVPYQKQQTPQFQTQVYSSRNLPQVSPNFEKQTVTESGPSQSQLVGFYQQQQPSNTQSSVSPGIQRQTQTNYTPVQTQTYESTSQEQQLTQPNVEKQVSTQVKNSLVQTHNVRPLYQDQQQVYVNQQVVPDQTNQQVSCNQLYVPEGEQVYKAQQQYEGSQAQVTGYTSTPVFGDRISQQQNEYPSKIISQGSVQTLTPASSKPIQSGTPESLVVIPQQQITSP